MRTIWLFLLVITQPILGQPVEHVVLISIDGLRPEFYRDASWPMPTLQHMAQTGVSADGVRGVYPTITYPSHTTMITGVQPADHGIYYNSPFEPDGPSGAWYWYEKDIAVPTLWDALQAADKTSAAIFWPVSVGAPITYNVPEVWPLNNYKDFISFLADHVTPSGLLAELETQATGKLTAFNFNADAINREPRTAMMAEYLLRTKKPALMAIHLIASDHFQHDQGRDGLRVRQALAATDAAVEMIWDSIQRAGMAERTALVITGDHGFSDIHTILAPNRWLIEAGLQSDQGRKGEWRASFHQNAASAFLYLRDAGDQATLDAVRKMLSDLPPSRRNLFQILERADLQRLQAAPEAALALAPVQGVSFTADTRGPDLRAGNGGTHGFLNDLPDLYTGFIGYGAGFKPGARAKQIGLEDIAPIIAHLLALDFPSAQGTAYPGFFKTLE